MEWIHTTGKTVEEAKQQALLELGIDEAELEFEVVQEPKSRFLGLGSQDAQIRARVKPISRAKPERRNRRQRGRDRGKGKGKAGGKDRGAGSRPSRDKRDRAQRDDGSGERPKERGRSGGGKGDERDAEEGREGRSEAGSRTSSRRGGRGKGGRGRSEREPQKDRQRERPEERTMSEVPIEEQAEVAADFVRGLLDEFGLEGDTSAWVEDERVHVEVDGDDLGLLIGPGGGTMDSVRELVKTTLQRHTQGQNARVAVDIGGYGAKRRAALEDFARRLATAALDTGKAQVLEPMNAPDRKVVHDVVNEIEGVTTTSEGEEPRRRVVINPE